mmetsp:Transcript_65905/g.132336  ORF Transcript_65905/g.132336 Transcript_65905/m.132336 type:complete len:212 (-) Transcript_65905:39-674(-)
MSSQPHHHMHTSLARSLLLPCSSHRPHAISTTAPASSSCVLASSTMSLGFPSMILPGLSTMPLASLRPTPRRPRTTFRMAIFLSLGTSFSERSNSVFSAGLSSSAAPPAGAAIITAPADADASTPKVSSMAFTSSEASRSVRPFSSSTMASVFSDCIETRTGRGACQVRGIPEAKATDGACIRASPVAAADHCSARPRAPTASKASARREE